MYSMPFPDFTIIMQGFHLCSAEYKIPSETVPLRNSLRSGKILAGSGVDLDLVADVAEQRNADLCAGLNNRGFGCTGCSVALEAGLGIGNLQLDKHRGLNCKGIVVVRIDLDHVVLFDELHVVADNILTKRNLVERLCVHEGIEIAILIQILILLAVDPCLREFLRRTESSLCNTAVNNIFQLGSYERSTFAGLNMLELNDLENAAVFFNRNAIPEITCRNHIKYLLK